MRVVLFLLFLSSCAGAKLKGSKDLRFSTRLKKESKRKFSCVTIVPQKHISGVVSKKSGCYVWAKITNVSKTQTDFKSGNSFKVIFVTDDCKKISLNKSYTGELGSMNYNNPPDPRKSNLVDFYFHEDKNNFQYCEVQAQ